MNGNRYVDEILPLEERLKSGAPDSPERYRVQKMGWAGTTKSPDRSAIVYNDWITLTGIPYEAHEYVVGPRSALEWLQDRYRVTTDKASGIVNEPNDWGAEMGDPRYIIDLVKAGIDCQRGNHDNCEGFAAT